MQYELLLKSQQHDVGNDIMARNLLIKEVAASVSSLSTIHRVPGYLVALVQAVEA